MPVIHAASPSAAPMLVVGEPSRVAHSPTKILGPLRSDGVVVLHIREELIRTLVVVVVQHIRLHPLQRGRRDQLQLRILRLDRLVELRIARLRSCPSDRTRPRCRSRHTSMGNGAGCPSFARTAPHLVEASPVANSISSSASSTNGCQRGSGDDVVALQRVARIHRQHRSRSSGPPSTPGTRADPCRLTTGSSMGCDASAGRPAGRSSSSSRSARRSGRPPGSCRRAAAGTSDASPPSSPSGRHGCRSRDSCRSAETARPDRATPYRHVPRSSSR